MKKTLGWMLAATLALGATSAPAAGIHLPGPNVRAVVGTHGFDNTAWEYIMPVYHANIVHSATMGGRCEAPAGLSERTIAMSIYDQLATHVKDDGDDQAALRIMIIACALWPPVTESANKF